MIRIFQTGFIVPLLWLTPFWSMGIRYLVCGRGTTILVRFADNDCCPWNPSVGELWRRVVLVTRFLCSAAEGRLARDPGTMAKVTTAD